MIVRTAMLAALIAFPPTAFGDADAPEWVAEARQKSAQLQSRLADALGEALVTRGPSGGVEVCNTKAQEIAGRISDDRFEIGRTALRVRNRNNAPATWETSVLARFERSLGRGADPAGLEAWHVETTDAGRIGRYMKAIPTGPQCVLCHGENIAPDLRETIQRLYPEDQATGFAPGELRGAFSARVKLPAID